MSTANLVKTLARQGVTLALDGNKLIYTADKPIPQALELTVTSRQNEIREYIAANNAICELLHLRYLGELPPRVQGRLDEITAMHDTAEAERRLIAACEHLGITGAGIAAAAERAMHTWLELEAA